jgi:hypothetical protein
MVLEHSRKKARMRYSINLHLSVKNKQRNRLDKKKEKQAPCNVQSWKVSEMPSLNEDENMW